MMAWPHHVMSHVQGLRAPFFKAVGLSMLANALMIAPSLYMLQVYDRVMVSQNELTLLTLSVLLLAALLGVAWLENKRTQYLVQMGLRLDAALAPVVFEASLNQQTQQATPNPYQPLADLTQLRQFVTGQGIFVLFDVPWFPIYIVVMFLLHPWLGVVGLVFALLFVALALLGNRINAQPVEAATEQSRQVQADQMSKLRNAETIHAMGMLAALRARWLRVFADFVRAQAQADATQHGFSSLSKWVKNIQQTLTLGAGALLVITGDISPGAMIAANILMTKALQPLDLLVSTWAQYLAASQALVRLQAVLQQAPPAAHQFKRAALKGHVRLVNFSVLSVDQVPILKDWTAELQPGTVTAVTGPSGSGKTSLLKALLGLWPHQQCRGKLTLDGVGLRDWDRQELGPQVGYLPQDTVLLEGSLAQNIARFGELNATAVVQAAKEAGIHDMVVRLPQGYDTPVGDAGQNLSGGQRQLVGLARALYGQPMLLLLDEPNASLDEVGDQCLRRAMASAAQRGATVVLVSHRAEVLQGVDRQWVVQDGACVQIHNLVVPV